MMSVVRVLIGCLVVLSITNFGDGVRFLSVSYQRGNGCTVVNNGNEDKLCNGPNGDDNCGTSCRETLKSAFRTATCENRLCRCTAECVMGYSIGDPHVLSFDGVRFGYQGVCKHVLMKTMSPREGLPMFTISARNTHWRDADEVSVPGPLEIMIDSWNIKIEIDETVRVNDQTVSLPYALAIQGQHELFRISVSYHYDASYGNITVFNFDSTFGLRVIKEQTVFERQTRGNGIYVYIPRMHPGYFSNTFGLFGLYDESPQNDFIAADGAKLDSREKLDVWKYGDSFCTNKSEATPDHVRIHNVVAHEQRIDACKTKAEKNSRIVATCEKLNGGKFYQCLGDKRVEEAFNDCYEDACYGSNAAEEVAASCNIVEAMNRECGYAPTCE